nr:hypothetical protein [Tanacetum cinerariifolium]
AVERRVDVEQVDGAEAQHQGVARWRVVVEAFEGIEAQLNVAGAFDQTVDVERGLEWSFEHHCHVEACRAGDGFQPGRQVAG